MLLLDRGTVVIRNWPSQTFICCSAFLMTMSCSDSWLSGDITNGDIKTSLDLKSHHLMYIIWWCTLTNPAWLTLCFIQWSHDACAKSFSESEQSGLQIPFSPQPDIWWQIFQNKCFKPPSGFWSVVLSRSLSLMMCFMLSLILCVQVWFWFSCDSFGFLHTPACADQPLWQLASSTSTAQLSLPLPCIYSFLLHPVHKLTSACQRR